ncbi:MAG: divalent metal cation transporter, partial [Flavobacteriaceae bacterium]
MRFKISIGPAVLITAAFIGPGTITLCVMAGVEHGFNLLWAMALSIVITIFIQNTAARIAWTTRKGLAKSLLSQTDSSLLKVLLSLLLISAIFIGNAAYEAGNLTGALIGIRGVLSLDALTFGGTQFDWFPYLLGGAVAAMLVVGSFRFLKRS